MPFTGLGASPRAIQFCSVFMVSFGINSSRNFSTVMVAPY